MDVVKKKKEKKSIELKSENIAKTPRQKKKKGKRKIVAKMRGKLVRTRQ
jgi:hypothetical protein